MSIVKQMDRDLVITRFDPPPYSGDPDAVAPIPRQRVYRATAYLVGPKMMADLEKADVLEIRGRLKFFFGVPVYDVYAAPDFYQACYHPDHTG